MSEERICPKCGYTGICPGDHYCEHCGTMLPERPIVEKERQCPHCHGTLSAKYVGDYCEHCGARLSQPEAPPMPPEPPAPAPVGPPSGGKTDFGGFAPPSEEDL